MPVSHVVDNDLELLVVRISGRVSEDQVTTAIARMSGEVNHVGAYRSLVIFERQADLSDLDTNALAAIRTAMKAFYRRLKLRRRAGAAVVDSSHDAKMILPLWNAICKTDRELDLHYTLFDEAGPALVWLGIPGDSGTAVVSQTEHPSR